jgi:GTP-binding protein YchF
VDQIAIIGLPNSGKSSLFQALTGQEVVIAPFAFSTKVNSVGVSFIYDWRLFRLAEISSSRKVVQAAVEFSDLAVKKTNAIFDSQLVATLRQQDAFCIVLRAFKNELVESDADIDKAYEQIKQELILADLTLIEGQLSKASKSKPKDAREKNIIELLNTLKQTLENEEFPNNDLKTSEAKKLLSSFSFLTLKDFFVVINVSEDQLGQSSKIVEDFVNKSGVDSFKVIALCAQLEAELVLMDQSAKKEMLDAYLLSEPASNAVTALAQRASNKLTFFTTGEKETRAWLFKSGMNVQECAGVIHSDLQKGFIKAEVVSFTDLDQAGSLENAHKQGKVRLEGREYLVKDGDILEIRFNI